MSKKIIVRKEDGGSIHANWHGIFSMDGNLLDEIYMFLNKNSISFRTNHYWYPQTRKGRTGNKYLNYIIFYKEEDANYFKLIFGDKLKIGNYEN